MKVIPITREYRRGYDRIEWDVDDLGVVRAEPRPTEPCTKVYPAVAWVIPKCNYQGC
jgi:hypothetical protein